MSGFKFLSDPVVDQEILKRWEATGFLNDICKDDQIILAIALEELSKQIVNDNERIVPEEFYLLQFSTLRYLLHYNRYGINIYEITPFIEKFRIDFGRFLAGSYRFEIGLHSNQSPSDYRMDYYVFKFIRDYKILEEFIA